MKIKTAIHVLPRGNKWIVKTAGKTRPARVVKTREEACQIGRQMAINKSTELIVHRDDGSIRSIDSYPDTGGLGVTTAWGSKF